MRIGIDATFLEGDSLYTGMGSYALELARGLATLSHDDDIVLLGYGERPQVLPERLGWFRLPRAIESRWMLRLQHEMAISLATRRLGLDLFHVPGLNMRLSRPGVPLAAACPLIVTVHDAIPLVYYKRELPWRLRLGFWLGLEATRRAARVITVSETSRRDLLNLTPLRPAQLKVVYNGVPAMEVPPASARLRILRQLKIEPPYLLYAGSYEPRKNLLRAVEAYGEAAIQRDLPPLVLLVERESGHRERTVQAIEASGLSRRLRWVHSLSEEELAAIYAEATLLVYPSLYEGFGFPPLQAMALGIPVIASDRGALPEILGQAAHYVEPTSTSSIREAILSIVGDDGHASVLAAAGKQQARLYRWEAAARQTHAIYQEVAQARAAAALQREAPSV